MMIFFLAVFFLNSRTFSMASALSSFSEAHVKWTPGNATDGIRGGYWPSWKADTHPPWLLPTSFYTHLFYAFLVPDATSYHLLINKQDKKWMRRFSHTLHKKSPTLKLMLSIGGGTFDPNIFTNISSTRENRATFIKSTIKVARKYKFDGLDLDWEFPKNTQDKSNLALLLQEWHEAVVNESVTSNKPRLVLSAAVYFASTFLFSDPPQSYPGTALGEYLDFINPMCYDYRGSWDTSTTGSQALLYDKSSNVSTSYGISSWISAVPSNKIVMGLPLYGRSWKLKDPNQNKIGAPAVGVGPGFKGVMPYINITQFNSGNDVTLVYDNETVSAYSYSNTTWIGYDDVKTITNKIKYAKSLGLGGYFFWALDFDDENWTISQTASSAWNEEI